VVTGNLTQVKQGLLLLMSHLYFMLLWIVGQESFVKVNNLLNQKHVQTAVSKLVIFMHFTIDKNTLIGACALILRRNICQKWSNFMSHKVWAKWHSK